MAEHIDNAVIEYQYFVAAFYRKLTAFAFFILEVFDG